MKNKSKKVGFFSLMLIFFCFNNSSFAKVNDFAHEIKKLIRSNYEFVTDDAQQLCTPWKSEVERKHLSADLYQNEEEFEQAFSHYEKKVLGQVENLQKQHCRLLAYNADGDEQNKYLIRNFNFEHFQKEQDESSWFDRFGHLRLQHAPYAEQVTYTTQTGNTVKADAHFQASDVKSFAFVFDLFQNESNAYFLRLQDRFYYKHLKRRGVVGREVEGDNFYNEVGIAYLQEGKSITEYFSYRTHYPYWLQKIHGGIGLTIWPDTFLDERGENNFYLEKISTLGFGPLLNGEMIFFNRKFVANAYYYWRFMGQYASNADIMNQQSSLTGGDLSFFPSNHMNYFVGIEGRVLYSKYRYTNILNSEKVTYTNTWQTALLWGLQF